MAHTRENTVQAAVAPPTGKAVGAPDVPADTFLARRLGINGFLWSIVEGFFRGDEEAQTEAHLRADLFFTLLEDLPSALTPQEFDSFAEIAQELEFRQLPKLARYLAALGPARIKEIAGNMVSVPHVYKIIDGHVRRRSALAKELEETLRNVPAIDEPSKALVAADALAELMRKTMSPTQTVEELGSLKLPIPKWLVEEVTEKAKPPSRPPRSIHPALAAMSKAIVRARSPSRFT